MAPSRGPIPDARPIFEPLRFRNLEVKNRVFRSSLAGRFDNYDGSGTQVRINWDLRFARGGVAAIISSNSPVHPRGVIVPGFAHIDSDETIPFWRQLARRVHEHDCKYIVQLAFSGRQRDIGGIQYVKGLSSTDKPDPLHGFECERMTGEDIVELVDAFAQAAVRAREAGTDGIEIHGSNGYLITQFLSPAINDRTDEYGGSLENRARFPLEVVRAVRRAVGDDYHLQFKISGRDFLNEVLPWLGKGTQLDETIQVCKWLEEAGVDGFHLSSGGLFPHPRNPAGGAATEELVKTYDAMLSSGRYTLRNFLLFKTFPFNRMLDWWWERPARKHGVEGISLGDADRIKRAVGVPVICAGGFQTASVVGGAIASGRCDAVSIARSLLANNDLVRLWEQGHDQPPNPCTYSNKCLVSFVEHPLGCYDQTRFASREDMIRQILSVFDEPSFDADGRGG